MTINLPGVMNLPGIMSLPGLMNLPWIMNQPGNTKLLGIIAYHGE
jgi:hypothetical protein